MTGTERLIREIEEYLASDTCRYEAMYMTKKEYKLCLLALKKLAEAEAADIVKEPKETDIENAVAPAELAAMIDGIDYAEERQDAWDLAKKNGCVIVFGYSDDNIEFRGAIDDELGAFDGGTYYVRKDGALSRDKISENSITALWYGKTEGKQLYDIFRYTDEAGSVIPWTYITNIPHHEFIMYEDGNTFCRGIVFAISDLK